MIREIFQNFDRLDVDKSGFLDDTDVDTALGGGKSEQLRSLVALLGIVLGGASPRRGVGTGDGLKGGPSTVRSAIRDTWMGNGCLSLSSMLASNRFATSSMTAARSSS